MVIGELIELLERVRDKHDALGLHDDTLWVEVATPEGHACEIMGVVDVENSGGMEWTVWIKTSEDTHTPDAPDEAIGEEE